VLERIKPQARTGKLFRGRRDLVAELPKVSKGTLNRRVGLYDLRHSRITMLVDAGGPLTGVQYLAGHKHLSTTARYAHAGMRAAEEALAALG
jgi:site-specific recombinase XerD